MWFKNLAVYQFSKPFELNSMELETRLKDHLFRNCGAQDMCTYGFVPALGAKTEVLVHSANGCLLICTRKEEKILPASVIRETLEQRVEKIEQEQDRQIFSKEKRCIKDDIILELLPKAFTRSHFTQAYIDPVGGWLVVNASSFKQAEELTSQLRLALGSLPITPPYVADQPSWRMTQWLKNEELPSSFMVGNECELREPGDEGAEIKGRRVDLASESIEQLFAEGMIIKSLALSWNDSLTFTFHDNLQIKKLKFTDLIQEQLDQVEADTLAEQMDADFSIMVLTFREFLGKLFAQFNQRPDSKSKAI